MHKIYIFEERRGRFGSVTMVYYQYETVCETEVPTWGSPREIFSAGHENAPGTLPTPTLHTCPKVTGSMAFKDGGEGNAVYYRWLWTSFKL